jgi:molybdopterin molybdotransferase
MPRHLSEVEDARTDVLESCTRMRPESIALGPALGRFLAEGVVATAPVQGFDNSAMDGFAVRAEDTRGARAESPVGLRVVGESRAGAPAADAVERGEAIAISTGAMLPPGADAVVRVEDVGRTNGRIELRSIVEPGRDIRRAGEDIAAGQTVVSAGARLGAAELGAIAAVGRSTVDCAQRPRLAVLTTGDELRPPGEPLIPGGAHDSNSLAIPALAKAAGAEVVATSWAPDELGPTREALAAALEADVVVACGGVSIGEHDHVRTAMSDLGVTENFWGVALKPGRPTWFGTLDSKLAFGLPGNPVSAMVTFVLFVRPALLAMQGGRPDGMRTRAALGADYEKPAGRAHALRARLELEESGWVAHPASAQGSHVVTSMLQADCLALIPTAATALPRGEQVEVELLRTPGVMGS